MLAVTISPCLPQNVKDLPHRATLSASPTLSDSSTACPERRMTALFSTSSIFQDVKSRAAEDRKLVREGATEGFTRFIEEEELVTPTVSARPSPAVTHRHLIDLAVGKRSSEEVLTTEEQSERSICDKIQGPHSKSIADTDVTLSSHITKTAEFNTSLEPGSSSYGLTSSSTAGHPPALERVPIPTRPANTNGRFQELFRLKMQAEGQAGGSKLTEQQQQHQQHQQHQQQHQQQQQQQLEQQQEQATLHGGQHDWERAMPPATQQETETLRSGNNIVNAQTMDMLNQGSSGSGLPGYADVGRDDRKPVLHNASSRPYQESPQGPPQQSQQIGQEWSATRGAPGLSSRYEAPRRQASGESTFNVGSSVNEMAPPTQPAFNLNPDVKPPTASAPATGTTVVPATAPVPAYRPQTQQSAYFQRMIAAKLAAESAMRQNDPSSSANTGFVSDPADAPASRLAFLPSSQSPMYQMLGSATGGSSQQQTGGFDSSAVRSEPGFPPVTQSPEMMQSPQQSALPYSNYQSWMAWQDARKQAPQHYAPPVKPESNPSVSLSPNQPDSSRFSRESMSMYPPPPQQGFSARPYGAMHAASSDTQQYGGGYREAEGSSSNQQASNSMSRLGEGGPSGVQGNGTSDGGQGGGGPPGRPSSDKGDGPKKAVLACHFCRGRKLKCDGERPTCSHCQRRNLACSYDAVIRRRGPGKKKKGDKPSKEAGGDGQTDVADKSGKEGKRRGRKPKDPNAPPKRKADEMEHPGPPPPMPMGMPHHPYPAYVPPPMPNYPHPHVYPPGPYVHYPQSHPAFGGGPGPHDAYIDPSLQQDRRIDYPPPGPPPMLDHRYDYNGHPYVPRPLAPHEEEHYAKRARYAGDPSAPQ